MSADTVDSLSLQSILEKALDSIKAGIIISPVVNAVLNNFRPEFISAQALMFADMIKDCEETGMPKVTTILYYTFKALTFVHFVLKVINIICFKYIYYEIKLLSVFSDFFFFFSNWTIL